MEISDEKIKKFLASHLGEKIPLEMAPIKKGGSDRNFFRLSLPDGQSMIFMCYGTEVEENSLWAGIAGFLKNIDVPVPEVFACDPKQRFILIEDLGGNDLWSYRLAPWIERRTYYFRVLKITRRLHSFPLNQLPADLKLLSGFDAGLYRWEHDYFRKNYVEDFCRLTIEESLKKELDKELNELTQRLLKMTPCLVHRDLQSQNIMVKDGRPVLLDFQGMREGNFFYDLGSLLYDPYINFIPPERLELLFFYFSIDEQKISWEEFTAAFLDASAQRLMQALGAYGFLGLKKNKPDFLQHIENGIKNLISATEAAKLPHLHELAQRCSSVKVPEHLK